MKQRKYIPVKLSRVEIDGMIEQLSYPYDLEVKLLYGCGLRLFECLQLGINDLNFDAMILTVHEIHEDDLKAGHNGTFMFGAFEKKSPNASKEFIWQWLFPSKSLTVVPETGERKRYYLHPSHVQKAIKKSVYKSKITKRATAHTFRHPEVSGQVICYKPIMIYGQSRNF